MAGSKFAALGSLGDFRSGYSARKKLDTKPEFATHWLFPVRAIAEGSSSVIDWSKLEPILFEADDRRYTLKAGDVLISIRGKIFALHIREVPAKVLAMSNWAIFSPNSEVDGEFLAWWFNLPSTQRQLSKKSLGTMVSFISLKDLQEIKIPVPSLTRQKRICQLQALRQRERDLVQRLEFQRDRLMNGLSLKLLEI